MFQRKYYLYLDEAQYSVIIRSLIEMKNKLIHEGRFTDCVDELLIKILSAPTKKI